MAFREAFSADLDTDCSEAARRMSKMRFRDLFTPRDRVRYILWRLSGQRHDIRLKMLSGYCLLMRRQTRLARDYGTAYEVFVGQPYNISVEDVRTIVDLGANVGYSALYFAILHPRATIYAFEPHPAHFSRAKKLIEANSVADRVMLIQAAAATDNGEVLLSDSGTCSKIVDDGGMTTIAVPTVDVFSWCQTIGKIDLLKIDIEGGEYPLLCDPRFRDLDCRNIVMEWHNTPAQKDGAGWCAAALRAAGYASMAEFRDPDKCDAGIIHAVKTSATHFTVSS
jgi:FkbM family methyltransferase